MACRVGITQDMETRKAFWQRDYPRLRNFRRISTHRTKSAAQAAETKKARAHGCDHHPGGGGPERGTWYVYHFTY